MKAIHQPTTSIKRPRRRAAVMADGIAGALEAEIRGLVPGTGLPSERDLAARFRANRMTVRRAIQTLRRRGLVYSVVGKGLFRAGASAASGGPGTAVGGVIALGMPSMDSYNVEVVSSVVAEAEKHGLRVQPHLTSLSAADEAVYLRSLLNQPDLRGLLVHPPLDQKEFPVVSALYEKLVFCGVRVVLLNVPGRTWAFDHVGFDDRAGMAMMVQHLARLGHRRIALLTPARDTFRREVRMAGYQAAMEMLGLPDGVAFITYRDDAHPVQGYDTARFDRDPVAAVCRHDVTAFLAQNESLAWAVWHRLEEGGLRVPDDVSVAGYDRVDHILYPLPRALTSARRDRRVLGATAFNLLLSRLMGGGDGDGTGVPREVLLPVELMPGASCGEVSRGACRVTKER